MKLSEIQGERAIDVLADIIEPAATIFADEEIASALKADKRLPAAKLALKKHKKEVIEVLAALDGVPPEEWKGGILAPITRTLEILNTPELISLFSSPSQNERQSGSTSESAEG